MRPALLAALLLPFGAAAAPPATPEASGGLAWFFSDELDRPHRCKSCHEQLDFTQCKYDGGGTDPSPR